MVITFKPSSPFRVDHVCLLVKDLDEGVNDWCRLLECPRDEAFIYEFREKDPSGIKPQDVMKACYLTIQNCFIELIQPVNPEGTMARNLARRGEGLHHISLNFATSKSEEIMNGITKKGFQWVGGEEWAGGMGIRTGYLHPKSGTHGVLVEMLTRMKIGKAKPGEVTKTE